MTNGRKSNVLVQDGIFLSMLKNHHQCKPILSFRFMPLIYDGWFLTNEKKIDIDVKLLKKIASFEDGLEKEDLVKLREEFQYDVGTLYEHEKIRPLINDTTEFIRIAKEEMKK